MADTEIERIHSSTVEMRVLPSAFAVPAGGVLGGVIGYVARLALLSGSPEAPGKMAISIAGCAVVALVLTLLTARRPDPSRLVASQRDALVMYLDTPVIRCAGDARQVAPGYEQFAPDVAGWLDTSIEPPAE